MEREKELIAKFIKANKLTFKVGKRNTDCTVLAGYCDFLEISVTNSDEISELIKTVRPKATEEVKDEFIKVFNHAYYANYGKYWKTPDAKDKYKF